MNLFKDLINTFDIHYIHKQKDCDETLKNFLREDKCSKLIIDYLFVSRQHARKQKEELLRTSIFNIPKVFNEINNENIIIVNELEEMLKNDICKKIKDSKIYSLV
jgi:hypothetical protein